VTSRAPVDIAHVIGHGRDTTVVNSDASRIDPQSNDDIVKALAKEGLSPRPRFVLFEETHSKVFNDFFLNFIVFIIWKSILSCDNLK